MQLVAALERAQAEVKAGRKYIDGLKDQIKAKQDLIDKLNARDALREKAEASLQAEIADLQAAIDSQKNELKIREDETDYLKKELSKVQKKLRSSYSREKILAGVAAILAGILILR